MNPALLRFTILLFAGFLGAAATGKLVPHARWLTETYDISLGLAGFAISAVMLPGAVLSAALGVVTDRLGARSVALTGLVMGAVASMALGLASSSFPFLIALRLVEGIGYCLLAVGATVLVVDTATESYRTRGVVNLSFPVIDASGAAIAALAVPFLEEIGSSIRVEQVCAVLGRVSAQLSRELGADAEPTAAMTSRVMGGRAD